MHGFWQLLSYSGDIISGNVSHLLSDIRDLQMSVVQNLQM